MDARDPRLDSLTTEQFEEILQSDGLPLVMAPRRRVRGLPERAAPAAVGFTVAGVGLNIAGEGAPAFDASGLANRPDGWEPALTDPG